MRPVFSITVLAIGIFSFIRAGATDHIVEEFGLPPTYSSISAAVSAASNGDRILIKNRAGNTPWIEDITISKSLEFLSFDNDTFFVVQGTYSIRSAVCREITIIGMRNLSGNITYSGGSAGVKSTKVNIMSSKIESGTVTFTDD